jgi:large-conductance mechanosensitive channel
MEQRTFLPVDTIRQEIKEELNSYKEFAFGRNLAGIAIALVLATSVQKFVTTFSDTLLMPIINYLVSNSSGGWGTWTVSPVPGMDFALGKFFGGLLEFIITTTVLYLIYSKIIKRLDPEAKLEKLDVEKKEQSILPVAYQTRYECIPTGSLAIHSGRPLYQVKCKTCDVVLHENTTGPLIRVEDHEREIHSN